MLVMETRGWILSKRTIYLFKKPRSIDNYLMKRLERSWERPTIRLCSIAWLMTLYLGSRSLIKSSKNTK